MPPPLGSVQVMAAKKKRKSTGSKIKARESSTGTKRKAAKKSTASKGKEVSLEQLKKKAKNLGITLSKDGKAKTKAQLRAAVSYREHNKKK